MKNPSLSQGIEAAANGDFPSARTHFMAAVKAEPGNEEAWLLLGHVLENPEQQRMCYEKVLQLNPKNELARISLGRNNPPEEMQPIVFATQKKESPPAKTPKKINWLRWGLVSAIGIFIILAVGLGLIIRHNRILNESIYGTEDFSSVLENANNSQEIDTSNLPTSMTLADGSVVYWDFGFIFMEDGTIVQAPASAEYNQAKDNAEAYMANNQYAEAVEAWTKVIQLAPHDNNAYYQRGLSYYYQTSGEHYLDLYISNLLYAAKDIQVAIDLVPSNTQYHLDHIDILIKLAGLYNMRVDRNILYDMAIEEGYQTVDMGLDLANQLFLQRRIAEISIEAGHCQEGLDLLDEIAEQVPTDDPFYGGIYRLRARAQACMGQLDLAIQNMDASLFNGTQTDDKLNKKALYLYEAGQNEAALQAINETLERKPSFTGYRYYVRAMLNAEAGDMDAAEQDLMTGENYTWDRTGLYGYVMAKLAFNEGDEETAIQWLQYTEASLTSDMYPLRERIIRELNELGAEPLEVTPSADVSELINNVPVY